MMPRGVEWVNDETPAAGPGREEFDHLDVTRPPIIPRAA